MKRLGCLVLILILIIAMPITVITFSHRNNGGFVLAVDARSYVFDWKVWVITLTPVEQMVLDKESTNYVLLPGMSSKTLFNGAKITLVFIAHNSNRWGSGYAVLYVEPCSDCSAP